MNPYIKIGLLFLLNYYCFELGGIWFGLISLGINIYKILSLLGITWNPTIFLGRFEEGLVYTKDYYGSYTNHKEAFLEASKIIETFKLKNYILIALYYDSPINVEESKLRSSIGIYRKKGFKEIISEELDKYCEEKGYNKTELPETPSLYCIWEYFNYSSMIKGIQKFYNSININLKNDNFKKKFNVDESKIGTFIEVYEDINSSMNFYIPIGNKQRFMIFKKDK